ncbi:MAG TPA: fibronectin type III domain-containing protein, partial [Thermoanaerobaculia bacterium]|nr:fibronectin type III domain-containing protein [Thermoanaerobaculia bacterium]
DLDGDGDLDAMVGNSGGDETIWLNDGTGTFSAHATRGSIAGGDGFGVALGDLDGDGDLDAIATSADTGGNETVWLNERVVVTPISGITTTEGGTTSSFSVVLGRAPAADVTIHLATSDASEGRISTDAATQQDALDLTFTNANWSTPRTITVHGQSDAVDDGDIGYTIVLDPAASSEPFYSGVNPRDVAATNIDDDTAGVNVSTATVTLTESGQTTFTVVLASQPTGDVVIDVSSSDVSEASVSTAQLTFTTSNWSTPRTVTVQGVADHLDDGDQASTIFLTMNTAATNDALYDTIDPADVAATTIDEDAPFGAPPSFTATATSTTQVALAWGAVGSATAYEIYRTTSIATAYSFVTSVSGTSFNDTGRTPDTTYLYKVRALNGATPSPDSVVEAATTTVFTDATLTNATFVKAAHITQLRTAVNAMRAAANLSAASFTDPTISALPIKAVHVTELRTALDAARSAITLPALTYTDPTITTGTTRIKTAHVTELRAGTQ